MTIGYYVAVVGAEVPLGSGDRDCGAMRATAAKGVT